MSSLIRCLQCRATFIEPFETCDLCGGAIEVSVPLTGLEMECVIGNVGTVTDSYSSVGVREIRYTAPTGSSSSASLVGSRVTIQVKPPIDVGRPGEPRVLTCIVGCLAKAGRKVFALPATDQKGEDGILQIEGDHVIVQIVTATPSGSFWGKVAKGVGEVEAELAEAVKWIRVAITEKAKLYPPEDRFSVLLAIDVVHMGVLADAVLVERYERLYGGSSALLGFGAIWIVGPTENHIFTLGSGRW